MMVVVQVMGNDAAIGIAATKAISSSTYSNRSLRITFCSRFDRWPMQPRASTTIVPWGSNQTASGSSNLWTSR